MGDKDRTHILFLVTASDCGACINLKGTGVLNNGRPFMNAEYLKEILNTKYKDYSVKIIMVNFRNLRNPDEVSDISSVFYEKNLVVQHKYSNENGKVRYMKFTEGKSRPYTDMDKTDTWDVFIKRTFSNIFRKHLYMYPSWYIVKSYDYNKSIVNPSYEINIFGVHLNVNGQSVFHTSENDKNLNNPIVIIKQGYDALDKNKQPKNNVIEEPVPYLRYVYDYDYEL